MQGNLPPGPLRISSRWTVFYRWLFPIASIAFLLWALDRELVDYFSGQDTSLSALLSVSGALLVVIVVNFMLLFSMSGKVCRVGDDLIVHRLGKVDRIHLKDVESAQLRIGGKAPSFAVVKLKRRGWFVDVQFYPAWPFDEWFEVPKVVKDLQERIKELNGGK